MPPGPPGFRRGGSLSRAQPAQRVVSEPKNTLLCLMLTLLCLMLTLLCLLLTLLCPTLTLLCP